VTKELVMINKIHNEDCLATMRRMPDNFIDLTVTSPPYDNLRKYDGCEWSFDIFKTIAKELFRVTKVGGCVVWVVADATKNGSETGTSFKQALYFKEIGFKLHDTMIYQKSGMAYPDSTRYHQVFEYMFILCKGRLSTFNAIKDRENKYVGRIGGNKRGGLCNREKLGNRFNVWRYANGGNNSTKDLAAYRHPAIFPEALARDHIRSWSNKGDLVYDPFAGSGTTLKEAINLSRNCIGSEISLKYCKISKERVGIELSENKTGD
jgi:site-specific DNA-methyltransferase (adenine-specific)